MTVGVVGMGPAGLRAAMLLESAGVNVRLFEARDRVGGRLHTVDGPDGLRYEAGGEWLDSDHFRVLELAKSLGIGLDERPRWPGLVVYRDEICSEADLWPDAAEDEISFETIAREMAEVLDPIPWNNQAHKEWDRLTLANLIEQQAASDRGRWWLRAKYKSDEAEEPERIGLLGWLCGYKLYLDRDEDAMSAFRIDGGMSKLLRAAADSLQTPIQFERPLCRIINQGDSILLQFEDGEASVDHVILALPPRAMERIIFDPALPATKRCAIEACQMSRGIKLTMRFSDKWWLDEGFNGSLITDSPLNQVWDASLGDVPVLNGYIAGDDVDFWRQSSHPGEQAIEILSRYFPSAAAAFKGAILYDWVGDTFAQGAFSNLAPGYVLTHRKNIGTPEGRIHFCGEHTAIWIGFVEGALESAERAVSEVLDA